MENKEKGKVSIFTLVLIVIIVALISVGATYMYMDSKKEDTTNNTEVGKVEDKVNNDNTERKIDIEDKDLKYFLGEVAFFNYPDDMGDVKKSEDFYKGLKLDIASEYIKTLNIEETNTSKYDSKKVNTAIKELFGENQNSTIESEFSLLKYNQQQSAYVYKEAGDTNHSAYLVKVENQEYKQGEYRITFIYAYVSESDLMDNNLDDYDCYRTTVNVKVNDNYEYSKYQLTNANSMTSSKVGKYKDIM